MKAIKFRPDPKSFFLFITLFLTVGLSAQTTRYVRSGFSGGGNGTSWGNASSDLQGIINMSSAGDQVWVARGTYYLYGQSLVMKQGVKIYGGFADFGTPIIQERNYIYYPTTIIGSGASVIKNDNNGLNSTTVIDGFTLTGGSANQGGGIYNLNSSPQYVNLTIKGNSAFDEGGGIYNNGGSAKFINIAIVNNTVGAQGNNGAKRGGGYYSYGGTPELRNILVAKNTMYGTGALGGGINISDGGGSLINVTVADNIAQTGSGVYFQNSSPQIRNSIIWSNTLTNNNSAPNIAYSIIAGSGGSSAWNGAFGVNGGNNKDADPVFSYPTGLDYALQPSSPGINAGNTAAHFDAVYTRDIDDNARIYNGTAIDMGPYEYHDVSIRYVRPGGTGNGKSWQQASGSLQGMINQSNTSQSVYVSAGTYQPPSGQSFKMKNGVKIYGGFRYQNLPVFADRDWVANVTTLQGNNSRVVDNWNTGVGNTSILDGFTITGGTNAAAGGAMINIGSSPQLTNLIVTGNTATQEGGGFYLSGSTSVFTNVLIKNNTVTSGKGGGIFCFDASPTLINTLIHNNTAGSGDSKGGGIFCNGAAGTTFINTTIANNSASQGSGIYFDNGNSQIKNTIIWGNSVFKNTGTPLYINSIIAGSGGDAAWNSYYGASNGNNKDADPAFINAAAGNFRPSAVSPAVNAGSNFVYANASTSKDLAGNPRLYDGTIDMGAYENPYPVISASGIIYVKKSGTGNGTSWSNPMGELADALRIAKLINDATPGIVKEIWVAKGTYRPKYRGDNLYSSDLLDKNNTFVLVNDLKVYGHFDGTETLLTQRNFSNVWNRTVLSGDLGGNDSYDANGQLSANYGDNAYHVVACAGTGIPYLDGFLITGGYSVNAESMNINGMALGAEVGAAIYVDHSEPVISNVIIKGNRSNTGGVIWNEDSAAKYYNMIITGNKGEYGCGGFGHVGQTGIPLIVNATITMNESYNNGLGIYAYYGEPVNIKNSILWGNTSIGEPGGAGYMGLRNSNNIIEGAFSGGSFSSNYGTDQGGNSGSDPLFTNANSGDFSLTILSPALEGGSTASFPGAVASKDIAGNPRVFGSAIDMGAYEGQQIPVDANGIMYVVKGATGGGSSWSSPVGELADALKTAKLINNGTPGRVKQIWVAKGTYKPMYRADNLNSTNTTAYENSFVLVNNVKVYGNFAGTETSLSARNLSNTANKTILSGDFSGNDTYSATGQATANYAENAEHVVMAAGNGSPELDGFTITGGNATYNTNYISVNGSGQIASNKGGGLYVANSQPIISNIIFKGNRGGEGGGVYNFNSATQFKNVLITGNTSLGFGGGYSNSGNSGEPTLTNITIAGNTSASGPAGIYTSNSAPVHLKNSVVWGNTFTNPISGTATAIRNYNNIIEGSYVTNTTFNTDFGLDMGVNSGANPLFTNAAGGDYTLTALSPAVNSGNTTFFTDAQNSKDILGNARITASIIDIGAYEHSNPVQYAPDGNGIMYVVKGATGTGSSWSNAIGEVAIAIKQAKLKNDASPATVKEIWVSKGTYKPLYRLGAIDNDPLDRNNTFTLSNAVKIYGHFSGSESALAQRDFANAANKTILSGDLGSNDSYGSDGQLTANFADNAYHVVVAATITGSDMNGFTVTGGNAVSTISPSINSNTITGTMGSGIYVAYGSPSFSNIIIKGNRDVYGGSLYAFDAAAVVKNFLITGNYSSNSGSGFQIGGNLGAPVMINSTITKNTSSINATGIVTANSGSASVYNSILWGNTAGGSATTSNVKHYNNIVQGSSSGGNWSANVGVNMGGNSSDDPLFTNFSTGDFTLQAASPGVDSGAVTYFEGAAEAKDIAGNNRLLGGGIDLGAYESPFFGAVDANGVMYVLKGASGRGSSWTNAIGELGDALKKAKILNDAMPGVVKQIWVSKGIYKPMYRQDNLNSTSLTDRYNSFVLINDVAVYGHFAGTETAVSQRSFSNEANRTTLSGDLSGDDNYNYMGRIINNNNENAFHVVICAGTGVPVLDGVTIKGGSSSGGGQEITVNGVVGIPRGQGAALLIKNSQPIITKVIISGNWAGNGGTVWNENSASQFSNVVIAANLAVFGCGGFCQTGAASPVLTNVTISRNESSDSVTGIAAISGTVHVKNSIIWGNINYGTNTAFSGVKHYNNIIQSGTNADGTFNTQVGENMGGNSSQDPVLNFAPNYTLQAASPARDKGNTALFANAASATDLAGNPRLNGVSIDIGAYEYQGASQCSITTTWNGSNWNNGSPISYEYAAIINSNYNSAQRGEITACSLTVNSGNVIIASGHDFKVIGAVTVNNSTATFTIAHNANLIQVNDVDNVGMISVVKESAPMYRLDYAMWASPVAGQKLKAFSPQTLDNRFYSYNPLTDSYSAVQAPTTTDFAEGKSYLIRVDNTHPDYVSEATAPTRWTGTFTGVPNNGDVNVAVVPNSAPTQEDANGVKGFNAIGNPYPSSINIAAFFEANANNLANNTPIFFWRKKNEAGTSSYASLTLAGYNANSGNPFGDSSDGVFGDPNNSEDWVINPGQGFIVRATNNTVAFNNQMRAAVNNGQMFRSAMDATDKSRLWLNITNNEGLFGQTTIAYTPNTTLDLDYGWDGSAMTDGSIAIYSLAGESKLGIQARPAFDPADEVPVEYKVTSAGSYTISLDHFDGVFAEGQDIYLRDNILGVTHNLQTAYDFTTESGVTADRFDVVYAQALDTEVPTFNSNSIIVYKQGSAINISTGNTEMKSVSVYDIRGRLLYSADNINAAETSITTLQAQEQMLIVQVTTVDGVKAGRKIVF